MNRQKRFYITLATLFVLTALLILGGEIFAYTRLDGISSVIVENDYRIAKMDEKATSLEELKTRYEGIETEIPKVEVALPDKKESSKLLSDLDNLATSSGLKLTLLQASSKNISSRAVNPETLQIVSGKYGKELPLNATVQGNYQNFVNFIKRLENYQRLISVGAIEITRTEQAGTTSDNIEVKLKMVAYLKK